MLAALCLVTQSCPTLCDPMDCNLPGSSVHGDCPGRNTGVGCHALLQGIFPTQASNPGLPHWRHTLYRLIHQGSPWGHKELDTTQRLTHLLLTRSGTLGNSFPLPQAFPHLPKHLQQLPTPPRIVLRIQITNSTLIQQIY